MKKLSYPNFSLTITPPSSKTPQVISYRTKFTPLAPTIQPSFAGSFNTINTLTSVVPIISPITPPAIFDSHRGTSNNNSANSSGSPHEDSTTGTTNTSKRGSKDNRRDLIHEPTRPQLPTVSNEQRSSTHKKEKSRDKRSSQNVKEIRCEYEFNELRSGDTFKKVMNKLTLEIFKKYGLTKKDSPKILFEADSNTSILSAANIQNKLYSKSHVTFYIMTEQNIYCIYFSQFGSKANDDEWMDDEKYRIYSVFKNCEFHLQEWKRKEYEDPDDDSSNILHAYGLYTPLNTEKEVIQTYCGIVVNKDKSMYWDENFDDYYECPETNKPFFNEEDDSREENVQRLIITQWK
ncbi:hypothetical protein EDI_002410 [Entamoeba dispar SAW760]|uniref:Uncharacterized protein n=1 Tax=Entamoeba dispar (strain ATCC PRA-260 / SAW760) TaxID=370354 RepID=B0EJ80_ENTDS|nr:uncharacterized protein EDI_002410 [Entamoeba dispar SAW760]EDR25388.1 hypothetical protein EDI_002410 [Entamoeba dispar SAW760]|eukprot:EDR25388.1 hypothetical protein EDI_002410 [Entamoeba dispar SAW760]